MVPVVNPTRIYDKMEKSMFSSTHICQAQTFSSDRVKRERNDRWERRLWPTDPLLDLLHLPWIIRQKPIEVGEKEGSGELDYFFFFFFFESHTSFKERSLVKRDTAESILLKPTWQLLSRGSVAVLPLPSLILWEVAHPIIIKSNGADFGKHKAGPYTL